MRKLLLITAGLFFFVINIHAQTVTDLFSPRNSLSKDYRSVAKQYQPMELNRQKLSQLISQSPQQFVLELPFENKLYRLDLRKVNITSPGFTIKQTSANGTVQTAAYTPGIFYQGKIAGRNKSFATISFYNDQVYAIISDDKSNITLGSIENNGLVASEYVMYRDTDLQVSNPFTCFTGETPVDGNNSPGVNASVSRTNAIGEPVDIYYECDFAFYQNKGSNVANVVNYVLGFFNNVALLYANENIHVQVSQIKVWTTADPYASLTTTSSVLNAFAANMQTDPYTGDYAHFLSTRNLGGGIAYLLGNPCASARQFRSAVSAINPSYQNFPTYSWTVEVTTHEQGHNFGSNHTQWCGWTGGALDNCYPTEGGCPPGPAPTNGGTIMSYCHLTSNGINFNNGFGQQPGDRIRTVIGNAVCFGSCRMALSITKTDASCGINNGSATVTPTDGIEPYTYLWSDGQTIANPSNLAPGTYYVSVKDAVNCEVMGQVIIANSGTTLSVTITPNGTVSYCTGGNITLTATNNAAYTYQWRRDGNPISGATANNYTASTPGSYTVVVSSGACNTTSAAVQVVEVPTPTASITASGPTTFCSGNNVILNANTGTGYQYQWFRDGNPISGATGGVYAATLAGSYTVRVSAGSCQATSSATVVTVNPSPAATITAGGPVVFCNGGSVTLNANTGTGLTYQWYRDGAIISGATATSYVASVQGNYIVVVSNSNCQTTSSITSVTVYTTPPANVTAGGPLSFCQGSSVTLNANTGTGLTYQWFRDGNSISGATGSSYTANVSGSYTVVVSAGNNCSATSAANTVTVNPIPTASITAGGALTFCDGNNIMLNAGAGAGYTYQWQLNGTPISGATQISYTAAASGAYTVVVSLGGCSRTSQAATVSVLPKPPVTVSPNTSTIEKFRTQTLTAGGAVTYNWAAQPDRVSNTANSAILRPLTTTVYTIEGTDNNNCKNTATATINVIGCGDVTSFSARVFSPGRVLISWINPDGATADSLQYRIAGTAVWTSIYVTGNEYELNNLRPNTDYEYRVIALCNTTSVYLPSAINTFKTAAMLSGVYVKLFPNPVERTGKLEIVVDTDFKLSIDVYNSLGQKVMTVCSNESFIAGQTLKQIDVSKLQSGIYGLAVWINNKLYNVKMDVAK